MKLRHLMAMLACTLLMACSTTIAETPQQKYFALKQDYTTALTAAVSYTNTCHSFPTASCRKHVDVMKGIDKRIATLIQAGDTAMLAKDDAKLLGYIGALNIAVSELRAYAIQHGGATNG